MCVFFFSSRRRHTRLSCDWSSDVCSSDLGPLGCVEELGGAFQQGVGRQRARGDEIGRASCRERVEISGGAVSLKKKKKTQSTDSRRTWKNSPNRQATAGPPGH